jgi:hypothetical protein
LYKYRTDITAIENLLKNVHTSQVKLDEIYVNVQNMNKEVKTFRFNINKKYLEVESTVDLEKVVYLINLNMTNELKYLQDYIDKSKIEIVEENTTINETQLATENDISQTNTLAKEKKYNEIYKISSETIVSSMKKDLEKVNTIWNEIVQYNLVKAQEAVKNEETNVNTDPGTIQKEKVEIKEINAKEKIDELIRIYIGFLNKENVFLTENAKINITEIKKMDEININSFGDIEYIYISLSSILTNISDNYISSSVISNIKTSDSLKEVITKVIASSKNLNKQEEIKP